MNTKVILSIKLPTIVDVPASPEPNVRSGVSMTPPAVYVPPKVTALVVALKKVWSYCAAPGDAPTFTVIVFAPTAVIGTCSP